MPSVNVHCAISKKRTKFDYRKLHEWIDKHAKKLGYNHRKVRHAYNTKDEKTIREYWNEQGGQGDRAVVEWLFHIALDNLVTAHKKAQKAYGTNTYNYFRIGLSNNSRYVRIDMERKDDEQLKELFDKEAIAGEDDD